MKRLLLRIWRILPFWLQRFAVTFIRPHFEVAVGAFIFNEQGQLLFCEHTYRRLHAWGLPGGDLKYHEDPVDGVKREVREETGLKVAHTRLLLAESSQEIRHITLTYLCTDVSGDFIPNEEVRNIRYFDIEHLPELFREHQLTIEKCLAILHAEK